jgi:NAD(P)H-dependent FMN reductase
MSPKLTVISSSTRPGRVGIHVARWVQGVAEAHGGFESRLVDLAEVGLPVYDEPRHPRLRQYEHEHTKRWSAIVEASDAFVFVTPEYNHSPSPALLNALDFVLHEWAYKPAGLVSYGGVSGGLRAADAVKLTLSSLKVVPVKEAVVVPFVAERVKDGAFSPNEVQAKAAPAMLDELARWAEALQPLRADRS